MKLKKMKLSDLNPAPYNPRRISPEAMAGLCRSIEEFGLVEPIIYNTRTRHVVGGHQRLIALQERGDKETDVVIVDLDAKKEKALNIALNNPHIAGEFTNDLQIVLEEIKLDLPDLFTELKLDDLYRPAPKAGLTDADALPDKAPSIVKTGEIWQLGKHRVMCGDSTEAEDIERLMQGGKADICFTSPPYLDLREYEIGQFDWYDLMEKVWEQIIGTIKPSGHVLINLGLVHQNREVITYWDRLFEWAKASGWPLFGWYVWDKGFGLCGEWNGRLAPAHEFVFYFFNDKGKANKWEKAKTGKGGPHTFRQPDGSLKGASSPDKIGQAFKIPDSVIRITRETNNQTNHPAVFPVELPGFALRTWSKDGDNCFDPFLGSGSTLIACEQLDRRCYGMEIEPKYCDVVIKRWEDFTGLKAKRMDSRYEGHMVKYCPKCDKPLKDCGCGKTRKVK